MDNLITVYALGQQLTSLLGLPRNCISFELRCAVGEIVSVKCEYIPVDTAGIDRVLAEYELVPRATPAAAEPHRAEVVGFDAWMLHRNECAHQQMMAHAGRGGRYYANCR